MVDPIGVDAFYLSGLVGPFVALWADSGIL